MVDLTSLTRRRALLLLLVFLSSVFIRILTAEYVDIGGDNAFRWMEAHRLLQGLGYTAWTHQTTRWAIALQVWAVMKLFGTHPSLYYILPIFYASLGAVFVYLIGERLRGAGFGLACALLTILFPQMAQTGSQLWPSVFQFTFLAVSIWLILVWVDSRQPALLVLAGVFFVLSWGSRETASFVFPGLVLLIWIPTRSVRAVLLFCSAVGVLLLGEWFYFWQDSGLWFGRLGVTKLALDHRDIAPLTLKTYLLNFLHYGKLRGLLPIMLLSLAACIVEFRAPDRRLRGLAWLYILFMFFMTYMVSSLSTPRLVHPIGSRYWCTAAPFGLVVLLAWLFDATRTRPRTGKVLMGILFAAFAVFTILKIPPTNSIIQVARDNTILAPLMAENRPIILRYQEWQPNAVELLFLEFFKPESTLRDTPPKQVPGFMQRGKARIDALFLQDVSRFLTYVKVPTPELTPDEYAAYTGRSLARSEAAALLVPDGSAPNGPPLAEVVFDRRLCHAVALKAPHAP